LIRGVLAEINAAARALRRPEVDLINAEEEARIRELIELQTWPDGWDGDEPIATTIMDTVYANGAVQPRLFFGE
jgi:DNA sulfur modification protein DndC